MWNLVQISLERCVVFLIFWPLSCVCIDGWLWFPEPWGILGQEGLSLYTHDPVDTTAISLCLWAPGNTRQITALLLTHFPLASIHTAYLITASHRGFSVKSNPNGLLEIVVCLVEKKKHVKPVSELHEKTENKSFCSTVHWGGDVVRNVLFFTYFCYYVFAFYPTGFGVMILP